MREREGGKKREEGRERERERVRGGKRGREREKERERGGGEREILIAKQDTMLTIKIHVLVV